MTRKITKELQNETALRQCAAQFGVVGDPTRMKICWLLCKHPELSVGEIADMLGVSLSAVSHALRKLREGRVVDSRREHKMIFYKLSGTAFAHTLKERLAHL